MLVSHRNEHRPPGLAHTILILVAMDVELKAAVSSHKFLSGSLGGRLSTEVHVATRGRRQLIVAKAGVGLVAAAAALLTCAEAFADLGAVVSLGVGGGLAPDLAPGDFVAASHILQHDCCYTHADGVELMAPGELHLSLDPAARPSPQLGCSQPLTDAVLQVADLSPVRRGLILSGSEFVGANRRKEALRQQHPDALVVEMESAALAQLCTRLDLPFAALKTVADAYNPEHLGDTAGHRYKDFLEAAASRAAAVVAGLLAAQQES